MEKEHDLNEVVCQEKHAQKAARGSDAEPVRKRKTATPDQSDDEQLGSKAEENGYRLHFHNDLLCCVDESEGKGPANGNEEQNQPDTGMDEKQYRQRQEKNTTEVQPEGFGGDGLHHNGYNKECCRHDTYDNLMMLEGKEKA